MTTIKEIFEAERKRYNKADWYRGFMINAQLTDLETAVQAEVDARDKRIAELETDIRIMVEKAADKHLGGYRELAGKLCAAEEEIDRLKSMKLSVMCDTVKDADTDAKRQLSAAEDELDALRNMVQAKINDAEKMPWYSDADYEDAKKSLNRISNALWGAGGKA